MKYIVISGSSDIGTSIINNLAKSGNEIIYTYNSKKINSLKNVKAYKLDISSRDNIKKFARNNDDLNNWDHLVVLPAIQNPIGLFIESNSDEWARSVDLNFTNQMFIIRELIPRRSKKTKIKSIMLWAAGGINNAPKYYSAYLISKVAQIKMAELLDKEFDDIKVSIIGPGWVKTKIHEQTLKAKKLAREHYKTTIERFKKNKFNSMKDVVNCFNKIIGLEKRTVGGRNFSVQFDKWREKILVEVLNADEDMYKLRRDFNDLQFSDLKFNILDILNLFYKNKNFQKKNSLIYKTFKRILYIRFILELKKKGFENLIDTNNIDKLIYNFMKKNKKRKIITKYLLSKPIKIKKLIYILK